LFEGYAARYSVLLPARRASFEEIEDGWQPRFSNDRFKEPWVCENCLAEGKEPHLKLHWKLPIALSCPRHRQFLKPIGFLANIDLRPLRTQQRAPPSYILQLDAATEQTMLGSDVKLQRLHSRGCLVAAGPIVLDRAQHVCSARWQIDLWSGCNFKPCGGAPQECTFEELSAKHQARFLEASASIVINLVANRKLHSEGREVNLLRDTRPRAGPVPEWTHQTVHPRTAWAVCS
jgi:hypothetical protein